MKLFERRRDADEAFAALERQQRAWSADTRVVRAWCARHRAALIVGGGASAGFAVSLLPLAPLLRLASALAGAASLMIEGPLLRMMAAHRDTTSRGASAPPSAPTP